jgi:hypothetical protein
MCEGTLLESDRLIILCGIAAHHNRCRNKENINRQYQNAYDGNKHNSGKPSDRADRLVGRLSSSEGKSLSNRKLARWLR